MSENEGDDNPMDWKRLRAAALPLALVLVMLVVAACGGGGDDEDAPTPTATTEQAAASPTAEEAEPTATEAAAEATPTEAEAEPTATEPAAEATPTEEASPTVAIAEDPFADLQTVDPNAIPNYRMDFTFEMLGIPNTEDTTISLLIEQSAVDNYHMVVSSAGTNLESWLVDGRTWLAQDGGAITELPEGSGDGFFSPSIFLQQQPPLDSALNAEDLGTDDVSGREANHYRIQGEDYLASADNFGAGEVSDVEGEVEVWIDTELNLLLKMVGDVTWTNPDGSDGQVTMDYIIDQIGSTPPVSAPQ